MRLSTFTNYFFIFCRISKIGHDFGDREGLVQVTNMEVSKVMGGTPKSPVSIFKVVDRMIWGYPHDLGNLQYDVMYSKYLFLEILDQEDIL
jgi:hypothetical protein